MSTAMNLSELAEEQTATVVSIEGDDAISVRLYEMGISEGESIRMVGRAPLGDPIEYEVCGYRLSLRKTEAARIQIVRNES